MFDIGHWTFVISHLVEIVIIDSVRFGEKKYVYSLPKPPLEVARSESVR